MDWNSPARGGHRVIMFTAAVLLSSERRREHAGHETISLSCDIGTYIHVPIINQYTHSYII